jgi:hypothetical protein
MISYHGTPVGGKKEDGARFLKGRHALVSFANPQDMPIVAEACASFVLDNGAFSMWRGGKVPDWDAYLEWVRFWSKHPGFDWWLIPDVIGGTEDENKCLMFNYGRKAPYGVPVYHMHESLEHAAQLAKNWQRVAIGSSGEWPNPGTESWWARMADVMAVMCDSEGRPLCKLHGLRMLDPLIFSRLPLSSADSCNAVINSGSLSRFGMYTPPTAGQRAEVIAARIENHNGAAVWVPPAQIGLDFSVNDRNGEAGKTAGLGP